ncbi:MAG: hypothetical protein ABI342_07185 [Nitrososphaera sp.]|jgi:hypothetical protein
MKTTKVLNLGIRKVGTIHLSKIVTLPKTFTENFLGSNMRVQISMLPDGRLILTPAKKR